jgi:hypothetical protein
MVFPYRTPASIDPEPITAPRPTLDRWVRAVSGAAVLFLLTATAMMFTLMRDIAESRRFPGNAAATRFAKSASHEAAAKPPPPPKAPPPPPRCAEPPRAAPSTPRVFIAPLGLSSLGATTHDPAVLLARAARLRADGAEITLIRSLLPMAIDRALEEAFAPHARIAARFGTGGIEIQSLPQGSTASLAGLQRGDVLTAVNGHALTRPDSVLAAYSSLKATGVAVLEVIRDERRIVLEARFSPVARPAAGAR